MVVIKQIRRPGKLVENRYTGVHTRYFSESEADFIEGIEKLCNTIGAEKIISVQFLYKEEDRIDSCILTYKE